MIPYEESPLFFKLLWKIMPYSLDHCDPRNILKAISIIREGGSVVKYMSTSCSYTISRFVKLINPHIDYDTSRKFLTQTKKDDISIPYHISLNPSSDYLIIIGFDHKHSIYGHTFGYVVKDGISYELESSLDDFEQQIKIVTPHEILERLATISLTTLNHRVQIIPLPSNEILQQNYNFIISNSNPDYSFLSELLLKHISQPPQ